MVDLVPLAGYTDSVAYLVNNTGAVVGSSYDRVSGTYRATMWNVSVNSFSFRGFFPPVANAPAVNQVRAGSAVPVKFSLGGDQGLDIFQQGFPASQPVACDSFAILGPAEETATAGQSELQYDPALDQYTYVWKTDRAWAGTCRQLVLRFSDGSLHVANFQLK